MWYPPRLFILLACPLPSLCRGAMLAAVVPLLVPSGGSPLVPACLMFSAVLRRFAPSLAARAWLRAVSPCVPRLVPHPASSRHRCRCLCCYRPMASRYPPRLIDTTGGAIRWCRGGSLDFACLPLGQPSHPCGSASDGDGGSVPAPLDCPLPVPAPWSSSVLCLLPALVQSDFFAVLPSCRPAVLPPHHLIASRPALFDTGDGAEVSCSRLLACAARFRLRSICAGSVEDGVGGCLACLAVVLCILSMG